MNSPQCGCNPFVLDSSAPPIRSIIDRTPRFEALAASNAPPLDTERPELQQKFSRAREYSANLDIRIAGVRDTLELEALLAEKATVDEYVEQTKAIFHPLRTLPTDVLGEIFSSFVENVRVCVESFAFSLEMVMGRFVDSRDIQNGPCVLTHVSSGWRHTALALPHLWSHIQLNLDRYKNDGSSESFLSEILSRSLNLPLHISLHAPYDISEHKALPVLLGTSARWQSASMCLQRSVFVAFNSRITLDALQTVRIYVPPGPRPLSQEQSRILERAPRLRSIVVDDVSVFLDVFSGVEWSQITHFSGISTRSNQGILTLFSKAVNLQHAKFEQSHGPTLDLDHRERSTSTVTHLQLGSLTVRRTILNHIDFPRLEVLDFNTYFRGSGIPDPLRPPTGTAIRELSVVVKHRDVVPLIAFLRSVPNLGTLEICYLEYFDIDLGDELVPQLHTLKLQREGGVQVTERLVEMIKARRASSAATLREVVIDCVDFRVVSPEIVNAFEELAGHGLEVHLVRKLY